MKALVNKRLLLVALFSLLLLAACGGGNNDNTASNDNNSNNNSNNNAGDNNNADAEYELRLGTVVSEPHPWIDMAKYFSEEVEERTDGKVTVSVHDSGTIGNDEVLFDELQLGTIDFAIGGSTTIAASIPEYQVFSFAYLIEDFDVFQEIIAKDSPIYDRYQELYEEKDLGINLLGLAAGGVRNVSHIKKEIKEASDLKGVKMRLPGSKIETEIWTALGTVPTSLPFDELYSGLQAGVAEGFDSTLSSYNGSKLYEVANNVSLTEHEYMLSYFNMSEMTAEKLPDEFNQIIEEVAEEAAVIGTENTLEIDEELIEELKEEGVHFTEDVDKDSFKEILSPMYDDMAEEIGATDILEMIREFNDK